MRFVVDAMLGKVALWLRLTGHDTIYEGDIEDDNALVIAEEEGRALLTADEELFQRANNRKLDAMLV
ncbi:MAG: Mut7-C RNAse domain-containing protein, partial [Candidatus Thorarchaeota archaeon]